MMSEKLLAKLPYHNPVGVELGDAVGRPRVERRLLGLRDLLHLAVQLRGRGLVEPARLLEPGGPDGVEQPQRAEALKAENGRKNVKSAPYRPILSEDRRRQRPTPAYTDADPAQNGQNGEN